MKRGAQRQRRIEKREGKIRERRGEGILKRELRRRRLS